MQPSGEGDLLFCTSSGFNEIVCKHNESAISISSSTAEPRFKKVIRNDKQVVYRDILEFLLLQASLLAGFDL